MAQKTPSEIVADFLNFLENAEREYNSSYAEVGKEDNRVQTFLHDMEFAPNKNERNKIATKLQKSRQARRKAKDKVQLYQAIHDMYFGSGTNIMKTLRKSKSELETAEKYLFGKREFKNRID